MTFKKSNHIFNHRQCRARKTSRKNLLSKRTCLLYNVEITKNTIPGYIITVVRNGKRDINDLKDTTRLSPNLQAVHPASKKYLTFSCKSKLGWKNTDKSLGRGRRELLDNQGDGRIQWNTILELKKQKRKIRELEELMMLWRVGNREGYLLYGLLT